jgi:hypothetical protein
MKKFCITFAGVVGSSKTPIATYLSGMLNLPIHNNDAIRNEVIEDHGMFAEEEYLKRRDARINAILEKGFSFILDASIDRRWPQLKEILEKQGYRSFIISLDLSKDLLTYLHEKQKNTISLQALDTLYADHEAFRKHYDTEVGLHISDKDFNERLDISYRKIENWLQNLSENPCL